MSKSNIYIETYGCQMNLADTEVVMGILNTKGFEMTENIKEPLNPLILIDGYWNIEVKDRIQDNGNGYAKMYYQKYRRPVKKVYKWELYVSGNHEKIIQENVQYYMEQLVYYEDLYNSSINV